jgi:ATP-dependent phosphoenolpyruvate carboxykinase
MWADKAAYDCGARNLSARFNENFKKFEQVDTEVAGAAPAG